MTKTTEVRSAPPVVLRYVDGTKVTDITQLAKSINWSGSTREISRKMDVSLTIAKDETSRIFTPIIGKQVRLSVGGKERFRGVIIDVSRDNTGQAGLYACDYNWYLAQSTVDYVAVRKTASQVIRELSVKYGIKVGRITDTKYVFPRLVFLKKTIANIIQTVLYETYIATKRRFAVESNMGSLELLPVTAQDVQVVAERGRNLVGANVKASMANVKTQVTLTGGNDEFRAAENKMKTTVTNDTRRKAYGLIVHSEHKGGTGKLTTLQAQAKQLLAQLSAPETSADVNIVGDVSVRAGRVLRASDPITGLSGLFWVSDDSHSFDANGTYTTQCTLTRTYEMEQALYEEPNTDKPSEGDSGASTVKGTPLVPGIKLDWTTNFTATAYNPALGGINGNGDGLVATGPKFSVGRSLAVDPKVIPYGSVVFVKVPGYPKADGIYLAEDTGGAIKGKRLDVGWYKTDCKNFGKRTAQIAILERGKGPADARAKAGKWSSVERKWKEKLKAKSPTTTSSGGNSAARDKLVKVARSKIGKLRYNLGGGNPLLSGGNIGDCSDFTQWCFKQIGVNTPNYSPTIWQQYQRVSRSQARPGDIAVFAGTIAGRPSGTPSHVGIVTTSSKMVNLQTYGCREEPFATGYWGKYLLGFVRVIND